MINTRIMIDGNEEEVQLFENMFEYVDYYGSDISHYTIGQDKEKEFIVDAECFVEDVDFVIGDEIEYEGEKYIKVNWGEQENSYINEKRLYQTLYSIYRKTEEGEYQNFKSLIFSSEEEAQKKADELNEGN
jgi:hypothetical protein